MSKATNRHCVGTVQSQGGRVWNVKQVGFEPRPEDSYGRCGSDKIRQTVPDESSGNRKSSVTNRAQDWTGRKRILTHLRVSKRTSWQDFQSFTGWAKKSKPDNFCNNFVYCHPIFIILAHIHYRKFATGGCIVSPPNMVCVTALPCKILTTTFFTLNSIHCCKRSSFYFGSNNCQFLWNNFLKESYRMNITYFQVTGTTLRPCDHCYGSRLRN